MYIYYIIIYLYILLHLLNMVNKMSVVKKHFNIHTYVYNINMYRHMYV